jgi:hypothetical protein
VSGPVPGALDEATPAPVVRARWRLVALLAAAGLYLLPWHGAATGAERAGAAAALALLASWGVTATSLLARTRRGVRAGEAATCAAVAATVLWLVVSRHPWLPGPDRRATLVPVFGPLAVLAVLDLLSLARRVPVGAGVAGIRAGAALLAAAALLVAGQAFAAGVAAFLWAAPVATAFVPTARDARRALDVVALLVAFALFAAPEIQASLVPPAPSVEVGTLWAFLHRVVAVVVAVGAFRGIFWPDPDEVAVGARTA